MNKEEFVAEIKCKYKDHTKKPIHPEITCPNCSAKIPFDKDVYAKGFVENILSQLFKCKEIALQILKFGKSK